MTNSKNLHLTKRRMAYRLSMKDFGSSSVGTGISWGFPQIFLYVWDGYVN